MQGECGLKQLLGVLASNANLFELGEKLVHICHLVATVST
jgi:hypothetical protein